MIWLWLAILAIVLMLSWAHWARVSEGHRPPREPAPPARLGAGFRASTESKLTRLADEGYRVRADD
jgi:hypothetical protein